MSQIKNMEGMTDGQIRSELARGGKFVIFPYTMSFLITTLRRNSDIHFIRAGETTFKYSWKYILLNLLLGWWGFPWGLIYTPGALFKQIAGGKNVTAEVLQAIGQQQQMEAAQHANIDSILAQHG